VKEIIASPNYLSDMEFHLNFVKMKMVLMYYLKGKTNFIKLMKSPEHFANYSLLIF